MNECLSVALSQEREDVEKGSLPIHVSARFY